MKKIMAAVCAASFTVLLAVLLAAAVHEYREIVTVPAVWEAAADETKPGENGRKETEIKETEIKDNGISEAETNGAGMQETETSVPAVILEVTAKADVLLAGDICIQDYIAGYYDDQGIGRLVTEDLKKTMLEADIMMANEEFAFSERGTPMEDKQYTFRIAPRYTAIFTELGIDIVSLANNHALDFGAEALMDSCLALEEAGIRYVGAGENRERAKKLEIIEADGLKIGFLAASRVIPVTDWNAGKNSPGMLTTYDPSELIEEIEKGKGTCDALIVYVHWGEERMEFPEEYQKTMARQYIDAGADAVIGAHPHVMQGLEYYKGKLIAYSLGNYIFSPRTGDGAMLRLTFEKGGKQQAQLVPFDASAFPVAMMEKEKQREFFDYMESISFGISIDEAGRICYTDGN
ncbi:MAG: CapA family protein [Lachnospiraceae bacterium]|nr:CapA family protein [Lachnospiraceae bacterium]